MNDFLTQIAANLIAIFLSKYGIKPTVGGMEIREYPPHIIFEQQARIPEHLIGCIDTDELFRDLMKYLIIHNQVLTAQKFGAYGIKLYHCPCGCGDYIYISIYQ